MKRLSKNLKSVLILGTSIKVLGLLYKIIITRILGIEGMRLFSMIMPSLSLALCLSSMCIPIVVNQNVASNLIQKNTRVSTIIKSAFHITFISSSIISIFLLLSFPLYKYIFQNTFIYYPLLTCIPLIYLSNTSGIMKGYLEANNHFHTTYLSNFLEQIAKITLSFGAIFLCLYESIEIQVFACFLSLTLSEVASFTYLIFKIKKMSKLHYSEVRTNGYEKKILKQAFPLTLEQLIVTLTNYIEPFLFYFAASRVSISLFESTTYYAMVTSYAIPLLIFAFFGVQSVAKFTFPKITQQKDNKEELHKTLSKAFFICFIIAIFNFMVCFFYSEETLYLLYKDSTSSNMVHFLAPLYIFSYLNPILVTILQSHKKEKRLLLTTIISSICTLIFIVVFTSIPSINLKGLILGIGLAGFIRFVLLLYFSNKAVQFKINHKFILGLSLLFAIYFGLNYLFQNVLAFLFITLFVGMLALLLYRYFYRNKSSHDSHRMHTKSF